MGAGAVQSQSRSLILYTPGGLELTELAVLITYPFAAYRTCLSKNGAVRHL